MRPSKRVLVSAVAITGVAAIAIPMATAQAAQAASCELEVLDKPEDSGYTTVGGMDSTGTYIAGTHTNDDEEQLPYLWDNGQPEPIEVNSTIGGARDVNSSGQAVGHYYDSDTNVETGFVFEDGEARELPIPDDPDIYGSWAVSINDDGVIGGAIIDFDGFRQAAYWPSADEEAVLLEKADEGFESFVRAVDADGRMVGQLHDPDKNIYPYFWDAEGKVTKLPGIETGYADALAGDYITGKDSADPRPSVMWTDAADPQVLEDFASVNAVIDNGTVAGTASSNAAAYQELDGQIVELPRTGDEAQGRDTVQAINEDGTVFGGQVNGGADNTDHHPAMWRCS